MSNVPMTLPDLVLATHKTPFFHSSTFVELEDGRILHAAGSRFTTSDDGGITWSDISERHDVNGRRVGGGGSSLVKLDGKGIGLAAMAPMDDSDPWTRYVQFWRSPGRRRDMGSARSGFSPRGQDSPVPGRRPPHLVWPHRPPRLHLDRTAHPAQ